ncbi:rhodanese-related sulfurtransferase [Phormidium sp. FACHB-592]|uniref:Rhodanese-like domain-containing protein n=1 Tax=Stenomitos frigidus AS-A4 TaxID=2933935 RepID=A0ABV0KCI5_9CYAN|nr:rhodanese-like domain-containing protein [Phormidium sp. FACHB-592]MBD2077541.1 rhodanese-related sulfurtransferase [Phormidium sp. FACHB-592]
MTAQSSQPLPQIRVAELAQRLATPSDAVQFVDVREASELALAKLDGFEHLPLSEFAEWSGDIQTRLDPQKETIVLCHHGVRSAQMCQWLQTQGFTQVRNVVGGIDAYAIAVDPSIAQY